MKYKQPQYKPASSKPTPPVSVFPKSLRYFDAAAGTIIFTFLLLAALFLATSAQGCGDSKATTSDYKSQFVLQLTYQPYQVYVHKSWPVQERQCLAQAVYAHLDVWITYRGYLALVAKPGRVYIHGKDIKFLNSPVKNSVQSYYDGVDEIHIVAANHRLPGLCTELERHQNVEKITVQMIPSVVNGQQSYLPSAQYAAWLQNMATLENFADQYAQIYQSITPCPYDGRK